jgi:hypothetical protein
MDANGREWTPADGNAFGDLRSEIRASANAISRPFVSIRGFNCIDTAQPELPEKTRRLNDLKRRWLIEPGAQLLTGAGSDFLSVFLLVFGESLTSNPKSPSFFISFR